MVGSLMVNFSCSYLFSQAWTADLCNEDSDGDGLKNGVELCDPDCNWQEGDDDPACSGSNSVSHPGLHNDNYQC